MSESRNEEITICPNCGEERSFGDIVTATDMSFVRQSWCCDECGAYGDLYFTYDEDEWTV